MLFNPVNLKISRAFRNSSTWKRSNVAKRVALHTLRLTASTMKREVCATGNALRIEYVDGVRTVVMCGRPAGMKFDGVSVLE